MRFTAKPTATPARTLLAECNDAKAAVNATLAAISASMARLSAAQGAPGAVENDLRQLDAFEAAQMAEWSRSAGSPMPMSDSDLRAELESKLRSARSAAAAAATAEASLTAEHAREAGKIRGIEQHSAAATAVVILETAEPLLNEFIDSAKALAAKAKSLETARLLALTTIESVGDLDINREAYRALGEFDRRFDASRGNWPVDPVAADKARNAWHAFAADLRDDASVLVNAEAVR